MSDLNFSYQDILDTKNEILSISAVIKNYSHEASFIEDPISRCKLHYFVAQLIDKKVKMMCRYQKINFLDDNPDSKSTQLQELAITAKKLSDLGMTIKAPENATIDQILIERASYSPVEKNKYDPKIHNWIKNSERSIDEASDYDEKLTPILQKTKIIKPKSPYDSIYEDYFNNPNYDNKYLLPEDGDFKLEFHEVDDEDDDLDQNDDSSNEIEPKNDNSIQNSQNLQSNHVYSEIFSQNDDSSNEIISHSQNLQFNHQESEFFFQSSSSSDFLNNLPPKME